MVNVSYFQVISRDDSKTWSHPVDITEQLRGCNPDSGNMQAQSAGNKVQTSSGRLLFAGHGHGSGSLGVCLWYSDDGGVTYKTNPVKDGKGEVSVANTVMHLSSLLINGRGNNFDWFPTEPITAPVTTATRGLHLPSPSCLRMATRRANARSFKVTSGTMFSSEPDLKKKKAWTISCSKDYGVSLAEDNRHPDGNNAGGYSDLAAVDCGHTHDGLGRTTKLEICFPFKAEFPIGASFAGELHWRAWLWRDKRATQISN